MENSVVPSKEMEANQPANPECGEGHNPHEKAGTECDISISVTLEERFRTLMDSDASVKEEHKGHKPLIGQVPMLLGMESELCKYFKPCIVSIGPLHHGEKGLEQGRQYKLQLAKRFIVENHKNKEIIYDKILKEIESFKKSYDQQKLLKKFHPNDEDLAWMFFVDGCALIQLVSRWFDDEDDHLKRDLLLLNNQLPLGVLNLVVTEGGVLLSPNDHHVEEQLKEFRKSICWFIKVIGVINFQIWGKGVKADSVSSFKEANHLLELFWMNFVKKEKDPRSDSTEATPRQFRSVKDHQAAGIILEPDNSSSSLRDISFHWGFFFCKLKIPRFGVSEQGKFLVFNLMAFEMLPGFDKDQVVTSYICFLNSIIATKEDVAELQKAEILSNYLPNDEDVIKVFRELTSSLKPYSDIFSGTKKKLIQYFNDKKSRTTGKWLSEAMQVYFRSPWTTIAFVSATFLLILTIIQTILSILPYAQ